MSAAFREAAAALHAANQQFAAGDLSPLAHSRARETALIAGLVALAADFGVTLQCPSAIDSRGELAITAVHPDGRSPEMGCGEFGSLSEILNRHNPRQGIAPGPWLGERSGWCHMNHFDAERMILEHAAMPEHESASVYRSAVLALLKGTGSEREAKQAERAYGNYLASLGQTPEQIGAAMRDIVKNDVTPIYAAHLRITGEIDADGKAT